MVEVFVEPKGIDLNQYKHIGEEQPPTLEFEPRRLYIKEIIRPNMV